MNSELEALVLALDAVINAGAGDEAELMEATYQSRLEAVMARHTSISRERLIAAVDFAHRRWLRAQKRPPTIPPAA